MRGRHFRSASSVPERVISVPVGRAQISPIFPDTWNCGRKTLEDFREVTLVCLVDKWIECALCGQPGATREKRGKREMGIESN